MTVRREVLVTGPVARTDEFCEAAQVAGWSAKSIELIAIYPRALDLSAIPESIDLLCVTSKHAVPALRKLPASFRSAPVAVVGAHTASLVEQAGFSLFGTPARNAQELREQIQRDRPKASSLLWPHGSLSDEFGEQLKAAGFKVFAPLVYETLPSPESAKLRSLRGLDAIFFASPSAVRVFAKLAFKADELSSISAIAIGATTEAALTESKLGFRESCVMSSPATTELSAQLSGVAARLNP